MLSEYRDFFVASTGASAAFIGLLFVGLSFIDNDKTSDKTKAWRRIIANSSFSQLANIFFVSLASLLPDRHTAVLTACVMAIIGIVASIRLLPLTVNRGHAGRRAPTVLGLVAVGVYLLELVTAARLFHNVNNKQLLDYLVLAIILLYAGALVRAWEITGVKDNSKTAPR